MDPFSREAYTQSDYSAKSAIGKAKEILRRNSHSYTKMKTVGLTGERGCLMLLEKSLT
jgi:hypothetical protein